MDKARSRSCTRMKQPAKQTELTHPTMISYVQSFILPLHQQLHQQCHYLYSKWLLCVWQCLSGLSATLLDLHWHCHELPHLSLGLYLPLAQFVSHLVSFRSLQEQQYLYHMLDLVLHLCYLSQLLSHLLHQLLSPHLQLLLSDHMSLRHFPHWIFLLPLPVSLPNMLF